MANRISLIIDVAAEKANAGLKSFKTAVAEAEGFAGKFKAGAKSAFDGVSGTVKAMGIAAVGSFAAFGEQIVETGAKLQSMDAKAKTVFGDGISQVKNWASENAAAMGLTQTEAINAAAGIQDLLVPMGFARDEATKMTLKVADLAGALSAWSGGTRSAAEVSQILTKAMLGERDSLKELGISITEADVQARLAEKGQKGLTGAALEQAKALATQELIFEKSTDAQKAWTDGSMDAAKQANSAKAGFAEMSEKLNRELYPAIAKLVPVATQLVNVLGVAVETLDKLQGVMGQGFKQTGQDALQFLNDYNDAIDKSGRSQEYWFDQIDTGKMTVEQAATEVQKLADAHGSMLNVLDGGEKSWEQTEAAIRNADAALIDSQNTVRGYSYAAQDAQATEEAWARENDRVTDRIKRNLEEVEAQWDSLTGNIDADKSWLNLQDQFDALATTIAESGAASREAKIATDDLKLSVIDYAKEVLGLPPERVTTMLAQIDQGSYDEVAALLDALTRNRTMSVSIQARGGIGYDGGLSGARAGGGPVSPGGAYLVGEDGPEVLQMGSSGGYVWPNGGGGAQVINLTVNAGIATDGYRVGQQIVNALTEYKRRTSRGL